MTAKEVYKVWAPAGARWTQWTRPVPFIPINDEYCAGFETAVCERHICYMDAEAVTDMKAVAVIVDLPGIESIEEGIALARLGFRPVVVYNGTQAPKKARSTVDNDVITGGLVIGAELLKKISIAYDAPPVFLLDKNRLNRYKLDISIYDNSWDVYHQDMPTGEYLVGHGIRQMVIVCDKCKLSKDLKKLLYNYQKKGIKLYVTDGYRMLQSVRALKRCRKDD